MKKIFLIAFFALIAITLFGATSYGQEQGLDLPNPLRATSIPELISQIFKTLAYAVAPPLAALFIVWGAIQMLTSGGDPGKFEAGIKTIKYTVIGLVVVLLGTLIARLVAELLGAPSSVTDAFR